MNPPVLNQYDAHNAAFLASASADAYAPARILAHQVVLHRATDTCAVVQLSETDCVVAFRGTADLRNWVTDCNFERTSLVWSAGKVHRGFNAALEAMSETLDATIHPNMPQRLWVTGHSLGGALALLFALRLEVRRKLLVAGVYTFGQPRVGNLLFSLGYDSVLKDRTYRVVHADDIVPGIPWLLGTYHHAGHEIFYGSTHTTPPYEMDRPWWTRLPQDLSRLARELAQGKLALLDDHHVGRYTALLDASLQTASTPKPAVAPHMLTPTH